MSFPDHRTTQQRLDRICLELHRIASGSPDAARRGHAAETGRLANEVRGILLNAERQYRQLVESDDRLETRYRELLGRVARLERDADHRRQVESNAQLGALGGRIRAAEVVDDG